MDPFLRRLSLLLALLVLAGCGQGRVRAPAGHPYRVTLEQGVIAAPVIPPPATRRSPGGAGLSGSCNLSGSGDDALVLLGVIVAVALVVVVVATVVDVATPDPVSERYYLTLTGDEVPVEVVVISDNDRIYLERRQYDALAVGAYDRPVIRPVVWEGTRAAPTQEVRVSVVKGHITIAPLPQ